MRSLARSIRPGVFLLLYAATSALACSQSSPKAASGDGGPSNDATSPNDASQPVEASNDTGKLDANGDANGAVEAAVDGGLDGDATIGDGVAPDAPDASDGAPIEAAPEGSAPLCLTKSAGNILTNPGFDTNVTGWTDFDPAAIASSWSPLDATGCATSGSLAVENIDDAGINSGVLQCVAAVAGTTYDFGVSIYLPSNSQVFFDVTWNSDASCMTEVGAEQQLAADTTILDAWQSLSGTAVAPAGTQSAQVYFQIVQGQGSGFTPLFDDAYLTPSPGAF
jgi:hypothetical protein